MTDSAADTTSQPVAPARRTGFVGVCAWCLAAIVVMGLGGAYGVAIHQALGRTTGGLMRTSFLVGAPLAIGVLVGHLARRRKLTGVAGASALSLLSVGLFVFAVGAFLREGTICIVMAAPLFIVLAAVGALVGGLVSAFGGGQAPKVLSFALVLPLLAASAEDEVAPPTLHLTTVESVHIEAPPAAVWQHINFPTGIEPGELKDGMAYRIGVPFPIEARTLEGRVGGTRQLVWQRGVKFEEIITAWEPGRHIAWRYNFAPESFPAGSLDDHIVIGGRHFNLTRTSYTLTPEGTGTRLTVDVGTDVTTTFNWYAGPWARYLVGDTARTILNFYKVRAERGPRAA